MIHSGLQNGPKIFQHYLSQVELSTKLNITRLHKTQHVQEVQQVVKVTKLLTQVVLILRSIPIDLLRINDS